MKNLIIRSLSAMVLVPVVLFAEWQGGLYFEALMAFIMLAGLREWLRMCGTPEGQTMNSGRLTALLAGSLYICIACVALAWLRIVHPHGEALVLLVLLSVWASDTGAFLVGSTVGGPKLAPKISPKKTWSGLIGGLVAAGATGVAMAHYADGADHLFVVAGFAAFLGLLAAAGDLLESHAKRRLGVKDTGRLIPGHGGVLDRVDGLLAAGIGAAVVSLIEPGHSELWP